MRDGLYVFLPGTDFHVTVLNTGGQICCHLSDQTIPEGRKARSRWNEPVMRIPEISPEQEQTFEREIRETIRSASWSVHLRSHPRHATRILAGPAVDVEEGDGLGKSEIPLDRFIEESEVLRAEDFGVSSHRLGVVLEQRSRPQRFTALGLVVKVSPTTGTFVPLSVFPRIVEVIRRSTRHLVSEEFVAFSDFHVDGEALSRHFGFLALLAERYRRWSPRTREKFRQMLTFEAEKMRRRFGRTLRRRYPRLRRDLSDVASLSKSPQRSSCSDS